MTPTTRQYELVVLLHPDLEIDVDAPIAKIEKIIESSGGKVIKRDNWGKKRLSYRINHHDFAVYVAFELALEPNQVRPIEQAILLTEEVIRHLIIKRAEAKNQSAKVKKVKTKAAKAEEKELVKTVDE